MATRTKAFTNETMCRKKALGVTRRFELLHHPLALPRWLMSNLRTIIQAFVLAMLNPTQELLFCSAITPS
jgi:hypothetical protein